MHGSKDKQDNEVIHDTDEGIRPGTTMEGLAKVRNSLPKPGHHLSWIGLLNPVGPYYGLFPSNRSFRKHA